MTSICNARSVRAHGHSLLSAMPVIVVMVLPQRHCLIPCPHDGDAQVLHDWICYLITPAALHNHLSKGQLHSSPKASQFQRRLGKDKKKSLTMSTI